MNLRTLKKLSKRAAPLLPLLGDLRKQFRAGRDGRDYHGAFIGDRKHWERSPCHPTHQPWPSRWTHGKGGQIVWSTRAGRRMAMEPPCHPRNGTMMVGGMSGYYEPEWDEESAWIALRDAVYAHFTDYRYDETDDEVHAVSLRDFRTVGDVFRGAADMIAEKVTMR